MIQDIIVYSIILWALVKTSYAIFKLIQPDINTRQNCTGCANCGIAKK